MQKAPSPFGDVAEPVEASAKAVVFVTQVPTRRDRVTGETAPSINIGPAGEHGQLEVMMPAGAAFYATAELVHQLRLKLKAYNFERGDSLLCLGDPAIIAVAGSVIVQWTKKYRLLKWDRQIARYLSVEIAV